VVLARAYYPKNKSPFRRSWAGCCSRPAGRPVVAVVAFRSQPGGCGTFVPSQLGSRV